MNTSRSRVGLNRNLQRAALVDLTDAALKRWPLPALSAGGDKEARGRVLIVAGSVEMPGAAILAANGALRAGAGKLAIATERSVAPFVAAAVPESRVIGLAARAGHGFTREGTRTLAELAATFDAVLVGPGMQDEAATSDLVARLRSEGDGVKWILDAFAMTDCVEHAATGSGGALITPHAGEMAHLTGAGKDAVVGDPRQHASAAASRWNTVVALKGPVTFIAAPDGRTWRHQGGNVGLAVSGSGDALAGIIAGLAARGASLEQAAAWGVALHARAGEMLAASMGSLGYLAREIVDCVPALLDALGGNALLKTR